MRLKTILFFTCLVFFSSVIMRAQGFRMRLKVSSEALKKNLVNDPYIRDVSVYLPPSYQTNLTKTYPVIYFLHGYTETDNKWFGWDAHWINIYDVLNKSIKNGTSKEVILVMPNANNTFKGSFYSNSETIGDWETFVTKELVTFIDEKFRTIPEAASRGLAGYDMGGYGAMRLGMKHPEVYSALYVLSPTCIEVGFIPNAENIKNMEAVKSKSTISNLSFIESINLAFSAAWASNPKKYPLYIDLAYKEGQPRADVLAKFKDNQILYMVDDYIPNLKQLKAIAIDVGGDDNDISSSTEKLHKKLNTFGIEHTYDIYQGDHTNKIEERISTKVLSFFSEFLEF